MTRSMIRGRAHRFEPNDDLNTDYIISGRYKFKIDDMNELARHVMEDISPDFASRVQKGDIIVAGTNFGCGSSREQAPRALKAAGISAVVSKSFARIFFRNSFNIGLPLVECDTDWISDGDFVLIDFAKGEVVVEGSDRRESFSPFPETMRVLLEDGGLIPHLIKHGGFKLG